MAVAVVSEPASLFKVREFCHDRCVGVGSYNCIRISDSASACVSPRATNDPSMSFWTFLFGPKRSDATFLAMLDPAKNAKCEQRRRVKVAA